MISKTRGRCSSNCLFCLFLCFSSSFISLSTLNKTCCSESEEQLNLFQNLIISSDILFMRFALLFVSAYNPKNLSTTILFDGILHNLSFGAIFISGMFGRRIVVFLKLLVHFAYKKGQWRGNVFWTGGAQNSKIVSTSGGLPFSPMYVFKNRTHS